LEAVRAGDTRAFAEAFDATFPVIRVFLYRYTQSVATAEELAQDVFVELWEERARVEIRTSLRTYLFVKARNKALNHLRHEELGRRWADEVVAEGERSRDDADWAAREGEIAEAVVDALEALPPRMRQIFLLHRTKALSYSEIASKLGVTAKTVETQIFRALKSLRRRLKKYRP
jgi:RNA polymerase sigma-70 factor (ECF subfamily)